MICKACQIDKPLSEYYQRKNAMGGTTPYTKCKPCHGAMTQAWREQHPDWKARRQPRSELREKHADKYAFVAKAKAVPCMDCKNSFPQECMDFDHVRGEKLGNIAVMIWKNAPTQRVREEMEKCELICANCHRIRTRKRMRVQVPVSE